MAKKVPKISYFSKYLVAKTNGKNDTGIVVAVPNTYLVYQYE